MKTLELRSGAFRTINTVPATRAKRIFGELLDQVAKGAISITRHDKPKAVLISQEDFESLRRAASPDLMMLEEEFDSYLAKMQTPAARVAMKNAFDATPDELGRAAVEDAREESSD